MRTHIMENNYDKGRWDENEALRNEVLKRLVILFCSMLNFNKNIIKSTMKRIYYKKST